MRRSTQHPCLIERTDGVLYALGPGPRPLSIRHNGKSYFRFHDFIYVSRRIEELNEQQVLAVCALRDQFATEQQLGPNRRIRRYFRTVIDSFVPCMLLELGPGNRPLYASGTTKISL